MDPKHEAQDIIKCYLELWTLTLPYLPLLEENLKNKKTNPK